MGAMSKASVLCVLWSLGAAGALMAAPAPSNVIIVVVFDGPFAGTFTTTDTACLHVKDRNTLGCGWKAFAEHPKSKTLEEAGIQVDTVSAGPGARTGDVVVKFRDATGDRMDDYSVSHVPMTLTRNGSVQQLSFDGRTKSGVHMRVTGTIVEVDEF
jgi:hypothetical protein